MTRRGGSAALAAVLAFVVAGCGDKAAEPAPLKADSGTSSSSTPDEPTAAPDAAPTLPPEARGTSRKSAIAFVEHAIDVLNYGVRELEPSAIAAISTRGCSACHSVVDLIKGVKSGGGEVTGGTWRPIESLVFETAPAIDRQVQVLVGYDEQTVVETPGAKPTIHPAGRNLYRFYLRRQSGAWLVNDIKNVS